MLMLAANLQLRREFCANDRIDLGRMTVSQLREPWRKSIYLDRAIRGCQSGVVHTYRTSPGWRRGFCGDTAQPEYPRPRGTAALGRRTLAPQQRAHGPPISPESVRRTTRYNFTKSLRQGFPVPY